MTLDEQQPQPVATNTSRRVSTMKKRYSNLGTDVVAGQSNNNTKVPPRRSVTLEMERIPSFRRLNGDSLFVPKQDKNNDDDNDAFVLRGSADAIHKRNQQRRHVSVSTREGPAKKRGSIQIQETKVMLQRVSAKDDAFFKDGSSHTLQTVSISASDMEEDPFFSSSAAMTMDGCSSSGLGFDVYDDESFFRMLEDFVDVYSAKKNHRSCADLGSSLNDAAPPQAIRPSRSTKVGGNPKYCNLGQRVKKSAAIIADEVYFVPSHSSPSDLVPFSSYRSDISTSTPQSHVSTPSFRGRRSTERKNRRSRSLESRDDASKDRREVSAAENASIKIPRTPRPLEETASKQPASPPSQHSSRHRRIIFVTPENSSSNNNNDNSKHLCEALQVLSLVKKSDDDDYYCDKVAALQQQQQLHWNLPKLLSRGIQHRRSQKGQRQQQQDELCQQFFGTPSAA